MVTRPQDQTPISIPLARISASNRSIVSFGLKLPSRLINDKTGETVGVAVTESMDVRIMQNAPYAANQH